MTTDAERGDFWDDELEQLSNQAIDVYGEHVVSIALERTFDDLRRGRTDVVSFAEFTAALKAELRRLVRPN